MLSPVASIFPSSLRLNLALLCVLALAACSKAPPEPEPVRSVKVVTVGSSDASFDTSYSGDVRARVESSLGFRVGGKLIARPAEIGQRVKAGQVLAEIDPQDYRVTAKAAASQLIAAKSNWDVAVADLKRYQGLFDQGFISQAELERRQAAEKAAQAQWQQAQAQNTVQGNQADYTQLRADGAGVITSLDASSGQVVAAGQPVVRLALDGPRDVVFSVPETMANTFKAGALLDVRLWGADQQLQAKVRDVAASADAVTRTLLVKAALPTGADAVLGATVTVTRKGALGASDKPRIKLPTSALRLEGGKTAVWLLDPATLTVKSQPIEVSTADGNEVLVDSGLRVGEQVVTTGVHVLTPGQKVTLFGAAK